MGKPKEEPNMSDKTLLMTVEDLINLAMGPLNKNLVNFKMVQTILHILARQMRMLEQRVEIHMSDEDETTSTEKHRGDAKREKRRSPTKNIEKSARKLKDRRASSKDRGKAEKDTGTSVAGKSEKSKIEEDSTLNEDSTETDKKKYNEGGNLEKKPKATRDKKSDEVDKTGDKTGSRGKEKSKSKDRAKRKEMQDSSTVLAADRRESIDVVTRSQFDLLERAVRDLQLQAAPPRPTLPANEELRADLARGSATLAQAMEAMQVQARVQAAEQTIGRLGELLTELAAAGALPPALETRARGMVTDLTQAVSTEVAPSVKIAEDQNVPGLTAEDDSKKTRVWPASTAASRSSVISSTVGRVTHPEMDDALRFLRDDLMKNIQNMTTRATTAADHANMTVSDVAGKLNIAIQLDQRISTLNDLVSDYADQLRGFDTGLSTQLQSFTDQINQLRADLNAGLAQVEKVNNNAETAAVLELRERYEGLMSELDTILHTHAGLASHHHHVAQDLRDLMESVEMLREQKADRDEVLDGLRDKANIDRLAGLLTAAEFAAARAQLEHRLEACHDKFRRQDNVWMSALNELSELTETKATTIQLEETREQFLRELEQLQLSQRDLELALGEPQAALVSRALAAGAWCGACGVPAAPAPLHATAPAPAAATADTAAMPCQLTALEPDAERQHACRRWCGGSHTLLTNADRGRARVRPELASSPTRRYTDYGTDGRLYMFEEGLRPCVECNQILETGPEKPLEQTPEYGAGDQGAQNNFAE